MAKQTNYQRLYRKEKKENKQLRKALGELSQQLESLIDVLKRLKEGELKLEDIKT